MCNADDEYPCFADEIGGCGIFANRASDELLVTEGVASPVLGIEEGSFGIDVEQVFAFTLPVLGIAGGEETARNISQLGDSGHDKMSIVRNNTQGYEPFAYGGERL